jgi:hypothetical protein
MYPLLNIGVTLPVLSARLGHSSVRVTADIYSQAIHGQDDEAARRWEEYRQRSRPSRFRCCDHADFHFRNRLSQHE